MTIKILRELNKIIAIKVTFTPRLKTCYQINEYVLKGNSIWQVIISYAGNWIWKNLLKLRNIASSMMVSKNEEHIWKLKNERYCATEVWNFIRPS